MNELRGLRQRAKLVAATPKLKMKPEKPFGAGFIVKRRVMNLFGQGLVGIALLMGGMVCAQQRVDVQIPLHDPDKPAIDFRATAISGLWVIPFCARLGSINWQRSGLYCFSLYPEEKL